MPWIVDNSTHKISQYHIIYVMIVPLFKMFHFAGFKVIYEYLHANLQLKSSEWQQKMYDLHSQKLSLNNCEFYYPRIHFESIYILTDFTCDENTSKMIYGFWKT